MTTMQRFSATWSGRKRDYVPLMIPCSGLSVPENLSWKGEDGTLRERWYSLRDEGLIPDPWELDDELRRVDAWASLGVDDMIELAFPRPEINATPPLQDVEEADEFAAVFAPAEEEIERFRERMGEVRRFARKAGVPVQVWAGESADHLVRHLGLEETAALANDEPAIFSRVMSVLTAADSALVEQAATTPGVDMIGISGRLFSPDHWTQLLFDRYTYPYVDAVARAAHRQGVKVAYAAAGNAAVTGVRVVDVAAEALYFVNMEEPPTPEPARRSLARQGFPANKIAVAGGVDPETLTEPADVIAKEVRKVLSAKPWGDRFILAPSVPLGNGTPWAGVEALIESWKERR